MEFGSRKSLSPTPASIRRVEQKLKTKVREADIARCCSACAEALKWVLRERELQKQRAVLQARHGTQQRRKVP